MSNLTVIEQIQALIDKFDGQFMKPDIRTRLVVSQIENEFGECRFAEKGEEYLDDGEKVTETYENACLCRLSAPGYMDCTNWDLCHDENDILDWVSREAEQIDELEGVTNE